MWSVKTKLWKNFITAITKTIEIFYLRCRNLLSTLLKRAKEKHFTNFCNENQSYKEDLERYKNCSINEVKKNTSSLITKDEKHINDPVSIANIFNNFFTSVAEIVHSKIKFSNKSLRNFLSSEINDFFLITSTNKEEIYQIISCLISNKLCEPNSIPTKRLNLLQDQILNHLATIFNLSFSTGVYPAILNTS